MKEIDFMKSANLMSPDPLLLVCTTKEDGSLNMAPVSFFMYTSFKPPMLAFCMMKPSNTGENLRRTGKAVLATPGTSIKKQTMFYGSVSGSKKDKLAQMPVELQTLEGTDLQIPADSKVAFIVTLDQYLEIGDHFMYICKIDKIFGDDTKTALFAWNGYAKVAPAAEVKL